MREVIRLMPRREYLYLGDNLNAPYGSKSQAKIFRLTLAGVEWLFDNGAEIVILACNTASANALRKIQKEVLPSKYPQKRVLGIIVPTAEEVSSFSVTGHIGVLATRATVISRTFEKEVAKHSARRKNQMQVATQSGGKLVKIIERDGTERVLQAEIENVCQRLLSKDSLIDAVVLGCTHYALIKDRIRRVLPKEIRVIDQGNLVALKLVDYLDRHTRIRNRLSEKSSLYFYTTSDRERVKRKIAQFYGMNIPITTVVYRTT